MTPIDCAACRELLVTMDTALLAAHDTPPGRALDAAELTHAREAAVLELLPPEGMRLDAHDTLVHMRAHIAACERCAAAAALVSEAERALAGALAASEPTRPARAVAMHAWITVRRTWYRRWLAVGGAIAAAVLVAFATRSIVPEVRRLTAPPPPVVTRTFSLACLSVEQAVSLVRPHLPAPQNPRWQAEHFGVEGVRGGIRAITVRAPREVIARVPAILERFEQDPGAACRRPSTGPTTP